TTVRLADGYPETRLEKSEVIIYTTTSPITRLTGVTAWGCATIPQHLKRPMKKQCYVPRNQAMLQLKTRALGRKDESERICKLVPPTDCSWTRRRNPFLWVTLRVNSPIK